MAELDFISGIFRSHSRDYLARAVSHDKAECAEIALQFGREYWDGPKEFGYGGYSYDGRWLPVAESIADHYGLTSASSVLEVGCGKGYLLYELTQAVPGISVAGVDISEYAVEHSKQEVRQSIQVGRAEKLPFPDNSFDLVVSVVVLQILRNYELWSAIQEIERVSRSSSHVTVHSYRTEREKINLLYWQLTTRTFWSPDEWRWFFDLAGYSGDHGFAYLE